MTRVAVAQLQPKFLQLNETLSHVAEVIEKASSDGARLVVFPESFISGYPVWIRYLRSGVDSSELDTLYDLLLNSAVSDLKAELSGVRNACKKNSVATVIGLNEVCGGTLYNSAVYIDDQGLIKNCHRKLMPTNPERMIWGFGDATGLKVNSSPIGKIGTLICFENYMPLARSALYAQGMEVLIAPTFASGDTWISTMKHIAFEGRCWVVSCGNIFLGSHYSIEYPGKTNLFADQNSVVNPGGSLVVSPDGEIVAGPLGPVEDILYCDIDANRVGVAKRMLDVTGHYSRPDLFNLTVNRKAQNPIEFDD